MTDSPAPLDPAVQARLDAHLDAIDRVLAGQGTPRSQRQAITSEVEAQVREMLAVRTTGAPTIAELEAVLAEIDPPEAYGRDLSAEVAVSPPTGDKVGEPVLFSRTAIAGAVFACIPFLLQLMLTRNGVGINMSCYVIPGAIAATVLGWVSILEIRQSCGRRCGLPLAVADAILYPLLILDALIVWSAIMVGFVLFCGFGFLAIPVGLLLALLADYWIIRRVWRAVNKSPKMAH